MTIYQQDPAGALIGPVELPVVPGAGLLIPSGFVQIDEQLTEPAPGKAWIIDGESVTQVEDHRGTAYDTNTGAAQEWLELGTLPEHLTKVARPSASHHWQQGAWVLNPQAVHATKVQDINHACEAAITAGFQSAALGAPHQYSSQLDDQLNLTGAILRVLDMPYACRDEQGAKAFRLHTAAQLRQVGDDFTLYKLQLLQRANELKQQLDLALAAGDAEAMQTITWEGAES